MGPYTQAFSRAKDCNEATLSKIPKRAAWVRDGNPTKNSFSGIGDVNDHINVMIINIYVNVSIYSDGNY